MPGHGISSPPKLCSLQPWSFPRWDWKNLGVSPSSLQAGPALRRRLNRRCPEVPSSVNSVIP